MNAFRPLAELPDCSSEVAPHILPLNVLLPRRQRSTCPVLFTRLLSMSGDAKERAVGVLKSALNSRQVNRGIPSVR